MMRMKVLTEVKKKNKKTKKKNTDNPQCVYERGGRIKGIELEFLETIFKKGNGTSVPDRGREIKAARTEVKTRGSQTESSTEISLRK